MTAHSHCSEAARIANDVSIGYPSDAPGDAPSIDELDVAICRLALHMNAETYRLLILVRDFDDRLGGRSLGSAIAPSGWPIAAA